MESQNIEYKEYPRNKNLAFAFYKAGFIESWGRGWKKICDGFTAAGLPKPTIESKQGGDEPVNDTINDTINEVSL